MKKKKLRILLSLVILLIVAAAMYLYFAHSSIEIRYLNKMEDGTNVSNVRCTYLVSSEVDLLFENYSIRDDKYGIYKAYHSSAGYGEYIYTFDIEVDGQIISPQIAIMKTDWKDHYNIDIEFVVEFPNTSAYIGVTINGKTVSQTFEDIQNNDIYMQVGP